MNKTLGTQMKVDSIYKGKSENGKEYNIVNLSFYFPDIDIDARLKEPIFVTNDKAQKIAEYTGVEIKETKKK